MGLILFLLVILIGFVVLGVRSIRAGYGKLLFWPILFVCGLAVASTQEPPLSPVGLVLLYAWAISVFAFPLWWLWGWIRRGAAPKVR